MRIVDEISIVSLISVSIPEAIIVAVLGILAIGKFNFFNSKVNLVKIIIFGIISSCITFFVRRIYGNVIDVTITSILVLCLLYIFIVRLKFYESILATLFGFIAFIIIQTLSLILISSIFELKLDKAFIDDLTRFLIVLPERLIEIAVIFVSAKFKLRIIDLESTNIKRKEYYLQLVAYLIAILTLIFLSIVIGKVLLLEHGEGIDASSLLLLRINIYLSLFVTIALTIAVRNTHEYYKSKNSLSNTEILQNLDYITSLIDNESYNEVNRVISQLKTHICKEDL